MYKGRSESHILVRYALGIMLSVSVILIFVAFVVLRFTIGFTISEEFREIGVMKAGGIPGSSIITQHVLRFVIVSLAACVISSAVVMPVSKVLLNFIFAMV